MFTITIAFTIALFVFVGGSIIVAYIADQAMGSVILSVMPIKAPPAPPMPPPKRYIREDIFATKPKHIPIPQKQPIIKTKCNSCGAPLSSKNRCDYCNTIH